MINKKVLTMNEDGKKVLKTIIDDESNAKGREDVAYTAKAVDSIIQKVNDSKADKTGGLSTDFNVRKLTVSNSIVPSTTGLSIGTTTNRFDSIYVNEAYLSTNTLYLGDTPVMGTDNETIMIKSDIDQSITMKTTGAGNSKIISENGVELSTSGPNADVIVQAVGRGSRAVLSANNNVDINAPNINITGDANINGPVRTKGLTVDGNMIINGETFTVNTTTVQTKDNIIEVNYGQVGNGVTAGQAGIKINRGDSAPYYMVFDETDDMFKVGMVDSLQILATQNWVNSNSARPVHTHTSAQISDATNANTANMIVKRDGNGNFSAGTITATLSGNASSATKLATAKTINGVPFDGTDNITITADPNSHNHDNSYAAKNHNQASNTINALTGYAKPSTTSALGTSDTLNVALGKLEKALDGKSATHGHPYRPDTWVPSWGDITSKPSTFNPASHTHVSSEIAKMTGYAKGDTTSAIVATDTLNQAISKIEVALDGKSATHTHPYRSNTWVPAWTDVTGKPTFHAVATSGSYNDLANKPTIHTINDTSTTSTTNTWSAKKINDSLAGKAASSHTHAHTQITGLGSAATLTAGTSANNVLKLDGTGKVPVSVLPSIAINGTFTAADQTAALKLTVEIGDMVEVTADSKTYICVDNTKTVFDEKFRPLISGTDVITKVEVQNLLNNKVDKISGKGLSTNDFTAAYKTKLDGIATGANNYVHPNDTNTRHVTDAEKSAWNGKAAGNHNHDSIYLKLSGGTVSGALTVLGTAASNSFKVRGIQGVSEDGAELSALYLNYQNNNPVYINGTNKVYHQGFKPTPSEIGAAAASHGNHVPATQTADARKFLRNDNTWQSLPVASTSATGIVQLNNAVNSTSTAQAATANAVKLAYDLAKTKTEIIASPTAPSGNVSGRVWIQTS